MNIYSMTVSEEWYSEGFWQGIVRRFVFECKAPTAQKAVDAALIFAKEKGINKPVVACVECKNVPIFISEKVIL